MRYQEVYELTVLGFWFLAIMISVAFSPFDNQLVIASTVLFGAATVALQKNNIKSLRTDDGTFLQKLWLNRRPVVYSLVWVSGIIYSIIWLLNFYQVVSTPGVISTMFYVVVSGGMFCIGLYGFDFMWDRTHR